MADSSPTCVDALRQVAEAYPLRVAIIDDEGPLSYADLQLLIEARAHALRKAGLQPGHRVALIAESSTKFLATALAIWQVGGVLVTIYPSSGADDLRHAVDSSDPALIVVDENFDLTPISNIAEAVPVVNLGRFAVQTVRVDTAPNPEGLREPLALICFSSGTSSRPKAIMTSHLALFNTARTYAEVWHFGAADRGIVCLPMAWLYGLASTSLALLYAGATVVVVRRARPDVLVKAIESQRCTFIAGVATTFAKLAQHIDAHTIATERFESLRLCISGGEPRNEPAFERWQQLTGVAVLDSYCASECLPLVTYDPSIDSAPRSGAAGTVVPRSKLKIVDASGSELPQGEIGEAWSSGPGLMLGYWRDDAGTREALTEDGWYRTKDLVRKDKDGYVHVVGRMSDVIIRAGTNISPAEVERVLRRHPGVAEVSVVGLPDEIYGQRVVAAVVPTNTFDQVLLREYAQSELSGYKVPSEFVQVDSLPVVETTGKVNRRRVAELLATSDAGQAG